MGLRRMAWGLTSGLMVGARPDRAGTLVMGENRWPWRVDRRGLERCGLDRCGLDEWLDRWVKRGLLRWV